MMPRCLKEVKAALLSDLAQVQRTEAGESAFVHSAPQFAADPKVFASASVLAAPQTDDCILSGKQA